MRNDMQLIFDFELNYQVEEYEKNVKLLRSRIDDYIKGVISLSEE